MTSINVLYQSDDNYAKYMGVSILSMLENNKDAESINVVVIDDNISKDNVDKISKIISDYGRNAFWITSSEIREKTIVSQWPKYSSFRKNTNCYLKYFIFNGLLKLDIDRIMYIDSDSVVTGSLESLFTMDMDDKTLGMTRCCLVTESYREAIGFGDDPYYNAGMNLFDIRKWVERDYPKKIIEYANSNRMYSTVDQDILNHVMKGDVIDLGCKYNYQCIHEAFPEPYYSKYYRPYLYYSEDEIIEAEKDNRIMHFMRFCGEYPWNTRSTHPCKSYYEKYRSMSPWKDDEEYPSKNNNMKFKLERMAYRIMPKRFFIRIFKRYHEKMLLDADDKAKNVVKE